MKLLLAIPNSSVIDFLYFALKNEDHEVIGFTEEEKIINYLEKDAADILVFDYDEFKKPEETLNRVRILSEKIEIIIITLLANFKITKVIKENRVYGIIPRPCSLPAMLSAILMYIEKILKQPSRYVRKHPRFEIHSKHNIAIVNIPEVDKKYIGKVKDISLGGIGIILKENVSKYLVFPGKNLKIDVEIENIKFSCIATVKNILKNKIIGLSFKEINPLDIGRIKNLILNIMKENTKVRS